MASPSTKAKISASGRISRVDTTYAFIISKKYGPVFVNSSTVIELDEEEANSNVTTDLTQLLRVDDVVHFKAVKNYGPRDCPWLAVSLRRSRQQENTNTLTPANLVNEKGVVVDVQDRSLFIWSATYGEVFCPLGVHLNSLKASCQYQENDQIFAKSMKDYFNANETVIFSAVRQAEENNCMYVATSVRKQIEQQVATLDNGDCRQDIGTIMKLNPHFGFIMSESLGTLFFSLSNCVVSSANETLLDLFCPNDTVKFNAMRQPEVNGCSWRALNVTKLEVPPSDEEFWQQTVTEQMYGGPAPLLPPPPPETAEKACQTHTPAESLLLRAISTDTKFHETLQKQFPHLMKMIDKSLDCLSVSFQHCLLSMQLQKP
ncbi:octanoyltransferase [Trichuris trichiura]|uniref:Octanoyltransferase n=1 Tax=Trichuris trichiura TaxID=36087 RepID=A0A077YZ12_TRITR|nr:octanoyltransferase [Trichuris trichiura]